MKLLSALLDTVLLPVAVARDVVDPFNVFVDGRNSYTRQQIEKIEEDIGG